MMAESKGKRKAVPLQAWSGPQVSRKVRFPYFMKTAQDGGKVVSLYPQGHSATGGIMSLKNSDDTIGNRTRDLPVCNVVPEPLRHPEHRWERTT